MNATRFVLMSALTLLLAGCGGDTYVQVKGTTTISTGQELTDLQRALTEGAITKGEYDKLYSRITRR